jgi:hypothetical protein
MFAYGLTRVLSSRRPTSLRDSSDRDLRLPKIAHRRTRPSSRGFWFSARMITETVTFHLICRAVEFPRMPRGPNENCTCNDFVFAADFSVGCFVVLGCSTHIASDRAETWCPPSREEARQRARRRAALRVALNISLTLKARLAAHNVETCCNEWSMIDGCSSAASSSTSELHVVYLGGG